MIPSTLIRAKREGEELSPEELEEFVGGFLDGEVTPYQMSAFLMATYFQGMTPRETAALTRVMVDTGETFSFEDVPGTKVDKHSTGGVGDLISLPLAPLVSACGVPVPMISGRGLGHTAGTLDKLESIPGFRTDLDRETFHRILGEVGCVMGGQTATLVPADRRMYALRDVTATVESIPLIVSSILSKKIAEGIDALVLDVKCGRGAFMKTEADALHLAEELTRVGTLMGKEVVAFVTDMDQPLGSAVGHTTEMEVALECLRGRGPEDTMALVTTLGAAMVCLGGRASSWGEAWDRVGGAVTGGTGLARFGEMVKAQGGDDRALEDPGILPHAPVTIPLMAKTSGFVDDVDPFALGEAVVALGGGRRKTGDSIDHSVGVLLRKKYGDEVKEGDVLAEVLAADETKGTEVADTALEDAYRLSSEPPPSRELIKRLVTAAGHWEWNGEETWMEANQDD